MLILIIIGLGVLVMLYDAFISRSVVVNAFARATTDVRRGELANVWDKAFLSLDQPTQAMAKHGMTMALTSMDGDAGRAAGSFGFNEARASQLLQEQLPQHGVGMERRLIPAVPFLSPASEVRHAD